MKTKKQIKEEIASLEQKLAQAKKELNTPEFKIGKWYKFTTRKGEYKLYVKVKEVTENILYYQDEKYISNGNFGNGTGIIIKNIENPVQLTNLSEIQQYLPDGHPDKIVSDKEGKYFTTLEGGIAWRIYKIKSMNKHRATVSHYINIEGERYTTKYVVSMDEKDRPSTKEEIKWLDACIKAGKFISKEEALETEEERLLKEAKRRYPVGTKFSCLVAGGTYEVDVDVTFKYESGMIYSYRNGGVYHKHFDGSKWAEIIPEVKKWDVGTYIVFIKNFGRSKVGNIDKITGSNFGTNVCLCEKELTTTKDEEYVKWFATKEEAEEFVKTLIPQLSVGDYFVSESYSKHIGRITEIFDDGKSYRYWGFSVLGPFRENDWYDFSDTKPRKATDKEIKEFLSNVAKYKYPSGVWVDQAVAYPGASKEKLQIKSTNVDASLYSVENFINVAIGGIGVFSTKYNIWAPTVFNRARKTENIKIIGGGEILRWSGYNDRDWWNIYSKEEGRNKRTDKLGQEWEIDYKNCEITLVSKPKGKFI